MTPQKDYIETVISLIQAVKIAYPEVTEKTATRFAFTMYFATLRTEGEVTPEAMQRFVNDSNEFHMKQITEALAKDVLS